MGVENAIFWSEIGQDLVNQVTHPHQEFPGVSSPVSPRSSRKVFDAGSPVLGSTNNCNLKKTHVSYLEKP